MTGSAVRWLIFPMLVACATTVFGQNKCTATGQMGGQAFNLAYCEVAYYEGSNGVTLWFSSTPITDAERDFFQTSSSAERFLIKQAGDPQVDRARAGDGGDPRVPRRGEARWLRRGPRR